MVYQSLHSSMKVITSAGCFFPEKVAFRLFGSSPFKLNEVSNSLLLLLTPECFTISCQFPLTLTHSFLNIPSFKLLSVTFSDYAICLLLGPWWIEWFSNLHIHKWRIPVLLLPIFDINRFLHFWQLDESKIKPMVMLI